MSTEPFHPDLIVHCDWGTHPNKRWMAKAVLANGQYTAHAPTLVGDLETLIQRIRDKRGANGSALIGFDFPIGVPTAYANQIVESDLLSPFTFLQFFKSLGKDKWADFFTVHDDLAMVDLMRPFYPNTSGKKKRDRTQAPFLKQLSVATINDLRRQCDMKQPPVPELHQRARRAASALFWTLGGNQVGKSAIIGWRKVIIPATASDDISLWPFHGSLTDLLKPGSLVLTETYPTQYHQKLFGQAIQGKRLCSRRKAVSRIWLSRAPEWNICLDGALKAAIQNGFSSAQDCDHVPAGQAERQDNNDDAFDAAIGLFGMIDAIQNYTDAAEPTDPTIRNIEGWILGQPIH